MRMNSKMKLKAFTFGFVAIVAGNVCAEEYAVALTVSRVIVAQGSVIFGTGSQPPNTCNSWGEYIKFDSTTVNGKNFLATLFIAKASSRSVDIWYTASTAPGTNQSNGCTNAAIAVLTGVALN